MRFETDHGVYGDGRVFIALYVDDMLMAWKQREVLSTFTVKNSLQDIFEMKDLGTATFLLRMESRRHGGGLISCVCSGSTLYRWCTGMEWGEIRQFQHLSSRGVIWG